MNGAITLGCDGLSALDTIFHGRKIHPSISDYDIVAAIVRHISMSPIQLSYTHVKGYQDRIQDTSLDRWSRLNIAMDHLAKSHIPAAERSPRYQVIPGEPWSIWYQLRKIISKPVPTIYSLVHSASARSYWENKSSKNNQLYYLPTSTEEYSS
jgi:hypothetical protein